MLEVKFVVNRNKLFLLMLGLSAGVACSGSADDIFGAAPATGGARSTTASTGSIGEGPTGSGGSGHGGDGFGAGGVPEGTSSGAGGAAGGDATDAMGPMGGGAGADGGPLDAGGPHSACDGKTRKVTAADPFIGDFESGDLHGWYDFGATGALNVLAAVGPGAIGTTRAGHLAAVGLTSFGAGMGFGTGCWDVSALDGISFWAKGSAGGDNVIQFQVAIPATHGVAFGGDCTDKCNDHPSKKLTLTGGWKQYAVAFTELTQAGFGAPAKYDGIMMAINWVSVSGPAVDFWVDEVALYAGKPSNEPVGRGRLDAGH